MRPELLQIRCSGVFESKYIWFGQGAPKIKWSSLHRRIRPVGMAGP
jgi:hypothetical protein